MDELAVTAKESFQSEAEKRAQMAWAKEQRNYEMLLGSFRDWIIQRRHTTSLIEPAIAQGRPKKGDEHGTILGDFGFTRSQWFRRKRELAVTVDQVDGYLDLCIEQSRVPSLYGLLREVSETNRQVGIRCTCPTCGNTHLKRERREQ
jgi:hypothetical protein